MCIAIIGGTWYNAKIVVGPQWYGFYPINHGILRIDGKFRPGTKKLQTTQLAAKLSEDIKQ